MQNNHPIPDQLENLIHRNPIHPVPQPFVIQFPKIFLDGLAYIPCSFCSGLLSYQPFLYLNQRAVHSWNSFFERKKTPVRRNHVWMIGSTTTCLILQHRITNEINDTTQGTASLNTVHKPPTTPISVVTI